MRGIRLGITSFFLFSFLSVIPLSVFRAPHAGTVACVRGRSTISVATLIPQRIIVLKTAKVLGLTIPQSVLRRANEEIQ